MDYINPMRPHKVLVLSAIFFKGCIHHCKLENCTQRRKMFCTLISKVNQFGQRSKPGNLYTHIAAASHS